MVVTRSLLGLSEKLARATVGSPFPWSSNRNMPERRSCNRSKRDGSSRRVAYPPAPLLMGSRGAFLRANPTVRRWRIPRRRTW